MASPIRTGAADDVGRTQLFRGEQIAGDASGDRCREENGVHRIEAAGTPHPVEYEEPVAMPMRLMMKCRLSRIMSFPGGLAHERSKVR